MTRARDNRRRKARARRRLASWRILRLMAWLAYQDAGALRPAGYVAFFVGVFGNRIVSSLTDGIRMRREREAPEPPPWADCPACDGAGSLDGEVACGACHGTGRAGETRRKRGT